VVDRVEVVGEPPSRAVEHAFEKLEVRTRTAAAAAARTA
jgi:hypothetical protein